MGKRDLTFCRIVTYAMNCNPPLTESNESALFLDVTDNYKWKTRAPNNGSILELGSSSSSTPTPNPWRTLTRSQWNILTRQQWNSLQR